MDNGAAFSCFVIGSGSLPIQCAQHLVAQGHHVYGIISPDADAQAWATAQNIPYFHSSENLTAILEHEPFDYLFSIINLCILAREQLESPRKLAINYHDGPLPGYAGLYATSWALVNRELSHGITWHVVSEGIDTGDILLQKFVPVANTDTAFTLNLKCYETAIESFKELVDGLSAGTVRRKPQDLTQRTYFSRIARPVPGGILRLTQPAREIEALVRALDFGPIPNPMGTPKLVIGEDVYGVSAPEVLETGSRAPAGTVTQLGKDFLQLATADYEIQVRKLTTLRGEPVSVEGVVERSGLKEGDVLKDWADKAERLQVVEEANIPHEAFWLKRLETLEPLTFPYMDSQGAVEAERAQTLAMPVPASIAEFAKKYGASGAVVYMACLLAWLARVSSTRVFDIGFESSELRELVAGFEMLFSPIVPLRFTLDDLSLNALIKTVGETIRSLERRKTFATDLFARNPSLYFARGVENFSLPIVVREVDDAETVARVPGSQLTVAVARDRTKCYWAYDGTVLTEATVRKAIDDFHFFVYTALTNLDEPVSHLPLTSAADTETLNEWNATYAEFQRDLCLHQFFELQAARTPDEVAVIFQDQQLTYRHLNARANQVAHRLIQQGVVPETMVGIAIERSLEMLVGVLGILKAGGAYVPLDPEYPAARLKFMVEDTNVRVILTQASLRDTLPDVNAALICLDSDWHAIALQPDTNPQTAIAPHNLAYVIYTSGSTGMPKGVMTPHSAIVNLLCAEALFMALTPDDRLLCVSALSFDSSVRELIQPIIHGAATVIADNEARYNGHRLGALLDASGATRMDATPSTLRLLLDSGWQGKQTLKVNAGGEAMEPALAERLLQHLGELWNPYGPTETTVECTSYRVLDARKNIPIGKPLANTIVYVLDANMQRLPIGVAGELYIGGSGVARGYLNRPELTRERFVPNPYDAERAAASGIPPAPTLYKTGDQVRFLPDGNLEFLGRIDSQVKLRGFRIELGEIESALRAQPNVTDAVVLRREDHRNDPRLAAYITTRAGASVDVPHLRQALGQTLPDYMVPAAIVVLKQFPRTSSGKLDRQALPPPTAYLSVPFQAPRTRTETTLAAIWAETLHVEQVGVDDPFFELGGHSLHAAQIISRVREAFSIALPLRAIFDAPTVAEFARLIDGNVSQDDGAPNVPPLVALPRALN